MAQVCCPRCQTVRYDIPSSQLILTFDQPVLPMTRKSKRQERSMPFYCYELWHIIAHWPEVFTSGDKDRHSCARSECLHISVTTYREADKVGNSWQLKDNFLQISIKPCCRYSIEQLRQDNSNEYPQHMFWRRNTENYPQIIIKYPPYLFFSVNTDVALCLELRHFSNP